MNEYQKAIYEKLNAALTRNKKEGGKKEYLRLTPGNTYVVRLISDFEKADDVRKVYYTHGWTSAKDGNFISVSCPKTFDEPCPICTEYLKLYKTGDEAQKELAKKIKRKIRYLCNVYVVDDPTNPENNNTVKILNYGQQLETIINDAWNDVDQVGLRMYQFDETGCNLRIKIDKNQGGFPTYTASKFLNPSKIAVTFDQIKDQIHDLSSLIKVKPKDELKKILEEGFYGVEDEDTSNLPDGLAPATPPKAQAQAKVSTPAKPQQTTQPNVDASDDNVMEEVEHLLKDMQ